jgi:hypothetical protein
VTLIIDGLLVAAAAFAGTYCFVLARRVRALGNLDSGIGGAITRMTQALEEARRALEEAKAAGRQEHRDFRQLVARAEIASAQLRVLLAATRDLPEPEREREPKPEYGAGSDDARRALTEAWDEAARPEADACAHRPEADPWAPGRSGGSRVPPASADDVVPKPARVVRPAPALLRPRIAAEAVAVPAGEADLLAALADFANVGRT